MKSVTAKRIMVTAMAMATGALTMGWYLISRSSGWVIAGIFFTLLAMRAMINSPATLGKTHTQIDPMPMDKKSPVARRRAEAVSHEAAAERPTLAVPISRPASQKSTTDLCPRDDRRPIPMSTAM